MEFKTPNNLGSEVWVYLAVTNLRQNPLLFYRDSNSSLFLHVFIKHSDLFQVLLLGSPFAPFQLKAGPKDGPRWLGRAEAEKTVLSLWLFRYHWYLILDTQATFWQASLRHKYRATEDITKQRTRLMWWDDICPNFTDQRKTSLESNWHHYLLLLSEVEAHTKALLR